MTVSDEFRRSRTPGEQGERAYLLLERTHASVFAVKMTRRECREPAASGGRCRRRKSRKVNRTAQNGCVPTHELVFTVHVLISVLSGASSLRHNEFVPMRPFKEHSAAHYAQGR